MRISESLAKDYVATHDCACGNCLQYFGIGRLPDGERLVNVFCPGNPTHHETVRVPTIHECYEDGTLPPYIKDRLEKGECKRMEQELGTDRAKALDKYRGLPALTKVQAMEVLRTQYPNAPDVEILKAAILCADYGLHPLKKHVYILGPFRDHDTGEVSYALAQSIGSKRLLARRKGIRYSYDDFSPRMMTEDEQIKVRGKVDPDNIWAATILDGPQGRVYGYGSWPKKKAVHGADKGNTQENMAMTRSESAALDRLAPGEMPTEKVEVVDEGFVEEVTDAGVAQGLEQGSYKPQVAGSSPAASTEKKEAPPTMMTREAFLKIAKSAYSFNQEMAEKVIGCPVERWSEPLELALDKIAERQKKPWRSSEK